MQAAINIRDSLSHSFFIPSDSLARVARSGKRFANQAVEKVESIWNYAGKLVMLTRHSLNLSLKVCHRLTLGCRNIDAKVLRVITKLKLFSIVGVPFNLLSIKPLAEKIFKNYALGDKEGAALTGLSLTIIAIDIVDSITTFINAISTLATNSSISILSAMGMPLSFGMVGLGSISRIIQLAKTHAIFKKIQHRGSLDQTLSQSLPALNRFLKENFDVSNLEIDVLMAGRRLEGLSQEEIEAVKQKEIEKFKAKKKAVLARSTNPEIVAELEKIYELNQRSSPLTVDQAKELISRVNRLQFFFKKKMTLDIGHLIANSLTLIGLSLFYLPLPPLLPFLFLALSVIVRLAFLAYQDLARSPALYQNPLNHVDQPLAV
jgi:hypothetical protein